MNSTIDTIELANGFQPAIDLDNREAAEENFILFWLIAAIGLTAASYYCRRVGGHLQWAWGVPYCNF
jgi:hypothetical protein